jgi:hypothetical protein
MRGASNLRRAVVVRLEKAIRAVNGKRLQMKPLEGFRAA